MIKKLLTLCIFFLFLQTFNAQNEFITTWKPSNIQISLPTNLPFPSSNTQAWIPLRGTNFTIYWEEKGYPAHNATLTDVNSFYQVLLDFGTPLNPDPSNATYIVKVSNGNGNFHRILFRDPDTLPDTAYITGDTSKIIEINQWGDIAWSSMKYAFTACHNLDMIATDVPNLLSASDMSYMFGNCPSLIGNTSINQWKTTSITSLTGIFNGCVNFNQPIGSWDTGNVISMAVMFLMAQKFNQPIGEWNTSKVTEMTAMFHNARQFNQPIGNWDVSKVKDMEFMFTDAWVYNQNMANWNTSEVMEMNNMFLNAKVFNQNISNWNTSKVLYMTSMFQGAALFNQDISKWNTASVTAMNNMFYGATSFNQNLGGWNLSSVLSATGIFNNSGLNCQNYDSTLFGWRMNPATPNNINLGYISPMIYSHAAAVSARNYLINNKGWIITGDTYNGNCESVLAIKESNLNHNNPSIYPNPVKDIIYIKNAADVKTYIITDTSGRIISKDYLNDNLIHVESLVAGNYILQIISKDKTYTFKFIKK
ncbi:BspA family leucine-rich repeat surface protein [Chryseobacterium sp.]|uniref:BspA family leucine-rich repeat surface protein n=1 Tax=Chryseobacterium sp. TaxID=1871047 RepID=UPI00289B0252|nr:BspA family leucine-rich repeat surface protein [Chryseobacterium sp.]